MVEPSAGRTYAFFESNDRTTTLYNPDVGVKDIGTEACTTDCDCISITCDMTRSARCTTCCDGECNTHYFCNC